MLACNKIPALDCDDEAIWARSRIIHFPYKFSATPVGESQKPIDMELKQKVKTWGPQFMLLLLEYYALYRSEGLAPTKAVIAHTEETRAENNFYQTWIDDNIIKDPAAGPLNRADVWLAFKYNHPTGLQNTLYPILDKMLGMHHKHRALKGGKGWLEGYRMIPQSKLR